MFQISPWEKFVFFCRHGSLVCKLSRFVDRQDVQCVWPEYGYLACCLFVLPTGQMSSSDNVATGHVKPAGCQCHQTLG